MNAKALKLSQKVYQSTTATLAKIDSDVVKVNPQVDIYNPEETEILLFDDGILVKGQKPQRQKESKQGDKSQTPLRTTTSVISTDIILLQKAKASI